jgi:hypothetical protein
MIDPTELSATVRALAVRAHHLMRRPPSLNPDREDIDKILEDIEELDAMISESRMHRTQLAAWARNLRREVASRARPAAPESIHCLAPSVITLSGTHA